MTTTRNERARVNEPAHTTLPSLNFSLRDHKKAITIYWTFMVLTSGIFPIVMYFALKYSNNSLNNNLNAIFGICLGIPGVESAYSGCLRTWRLSIKAPTYRPLGQKSRWAADFFQWNFALAFIVITALICVGSTINNYPCCSLPIAVLLLQLVLELIYADLAVIFNLDAPLRISSVAKGEKTRPASYTIVEDIVAVDGGQGLAFRTAWDARYKASPYMRALLFNLDLIWTSTAALVVAAIFAIVFAVPNPEIGYAVGWGLPWVWGGVMALITVVMVKSTLKAEAREFGAPVKMQQLEAEVPKVGRTEV